MGRRYVAQAQERSFTQNFSYANIVTALGLNANPYVSEEGFYNVTITIPPACIGAGINTCFTATAVAVGAQAGDTVCATLTIDDRGQRTSTNTVPADTTGQCW